MMLRLHRLCSNEVVKSGNLEDYASATRAVQRVIDMQPVEIYACIIDSFDNNHDAGTIASCALVCRAWLPFSRHKLYSKIWLYYCRQWVRFKETVLQCKSAALAGYLGRVQELLVWPQDEDRRELRIGWKGGPERPPWAHLFLSQCETHLTGLTYIYMMNVDLHLWPPMTICSGQHYHSLTRLELLFCTFSGILQLQQFVTSFPALSDLTLKWLHFCSKVTPPRFPKGGHPLTRLELMVNHDVIVAVTQWLSQVQLVRRLEYLNWWSYKEAEEEWSTLVNAIDDSSLQDLCINISHTSQADLSRFTCLKRFSLCLSSLPLEQLTTSLASILSTIAIHRLEKFSIKRISYDLRSLDFTLDQLSDLKDVDTILSLPKFHCLRHIQFEFRFCIIMQEHHTISYISPPTSSRVMPVLTSGSNSQQDLDENGSINDPRRTFKRYAEDVVRSKMEEELKQLNSRGILNIKLDIQVGEVMQFEEDILD